MRIWMINAGEPSPIDHEHIRLRRVGLLAQLAAEKGHDVVWWTSTLCHATKTQRFDRNHSLDLNDRYRINFLHAPAYKKNVSWQRIRNHQRLGRNFAAAAPREQAPDIILTSLPILELSCEAVRYARSRRIPVVLDVRDLWPDVMLDLVPRHFRSIARMPLTPYFHLARQACAGATAICAHTNEFVQWGLDCGRRERTPWDQHFSFGYAPVELTEPEQLRAGKFWDELQVGVDPTVPIVCFFGAINRQFDFDTVLAAARQVQSIRRVQFVLCGNGENVDQLRAAVRGNRDILFPGWVDAHQIWGLMSRASFGLAPYVASANFVKNLANKPIEYLAGGLPILCSLAEGPLFDLVEQQECGYSYAGSASKLCAAILHGLETPQLHATLRANASRVFARDFDSNRVYTRMLAHLEDLARSFSASYSPTRAAG